MAVAPVKVDAEAQRIIAAMKARNKHADPLGRLPDVHPSRMPRHIAIIMDGNGRWATGRFLPRMAGHRAGAKAVKTVVEEIGRLGVEYLTLYSFSMENWKRPKAEVDALMDLYLEYMDGQRGEFVKNNIRFIQIGRREGLPAECLKVRDEVMELTKGHTGGTLVLAVNYGSRAEIADACRDIARQVQAGTLDPEAVDEALVGNTLDTGGHGIPDPELLIRTAGESRVSNFLLWQISYAEIHVTPKLWPEFGAADLHAAIRDFAGRTRKFGGLTS